jgi:hypothetical protein
MPSASSPIREALEAYAAGALQSERLVITVAAAFYGAGDGDDRARLEPLVEVIDRAAPGIVELTSVPEARGFEIRVAERPFPKEHEPALKQAVQAVLARASAPGVSLAAAPPPPAPPPVATAGFLARVAGLLRRLFNASA